MSTIVSGVQTTGSLHLGNYLGAVKNWVELARQGHTSYLMLADLHAITVYQKPSDLAASVKNIARLLMACGLADDDLMWPNGSTYLFRQSTVPQHTELQWLLMGTARMGWLNRMTQFKDKGGAGTSVSAGLFAYPVLQAADILLYGADLVPVGDDQSQHLQLTRDIAEKFNADFGQTFKLPQALVPPINARVMSLQDPMKKMSKSEPNDSSRINLLDTDVMISKKYRAAVADSVTALPSEPEGLEGRVAVSNLVSLLAGIQDRKVEEVLRDLGGKGNGALKSALTDATISLLEPIKEAFSQLSDRQVEDHLEFSTSSFGGPRLVALDTMNNVKAAMGLWD